MDADYFSRKERLREAFENLSESNPELKFDYALSLIQSRLQRDIRRGVRLLTELVYEGSATRDYYYFLALAHYRMHSYHKAIIHLDEILKIEPDNPQALCLRAVIADKLSKAKVLGVMMVGTLAAVGTLAGYLFLRKRR
eukprot:gnl/Trimastix_PCT/4043.p1 GENE.gnl/Trimastix_PCT/4043~~gnl/Trimastix_PCT/4043.p1  ORF type:complete len:154 (-),score=11.93 gnl/Trimastix_PCT/4043:34-450(-)